MPLNFVKTVGHARQIASGGILLGCLALLVTASGTGSAHAQSSQALIDLINVHRSEERNCEGARSGVAGPLAAHAGLSDAQTSADTDLQAALKQQGYQPSRVLTINLTGPADAASAMRLIEQRYCRPLLDPAFADIGVSREGNAWRIVLARPVLSPDLPDWQDAGRDILRLTNQARAEPRRCGEKSHGAAPPLAWAPALAGAARVHSRDMARQNYFRHRAADGGDAADRVDRKGYAWRRVGENIAAGQGSAKQAVSAWLSSPPHCANLMNPNHAEMGAAYAVDADSDSTIYWTQVFATPR
jgi:uncharacterized protein YkwD